MKRLFATFLIVCSISFVFLTGNANAQFKDVSWKAGLQINNMFPLNEFPMSNGFKFSPLGRAYGRFQLSNLFSLEAGLGYGSYQGVDDKGNDYSTSLLPIDARLLYTPFDMETVNPYFFAGIGLLNFNASTKTKMVSPNSVEESGWTGVIPVGFGSEFKLSESLILDLSASLNYTLSDDINYYKIVDLNDSYINVGIGLTFLGDDSNTDYDHDGLIKRIETEIGTDPKNPDTDGDGLKDGEEYLTYKTDPLKADTDGDGLNDGDEVFKYKTDPVKADTDGDGLNDGDELMKFKTSPLNADTDGDGLKDGEEVIKFKTDPLKADTDGDGLNDGDEVLKYKTDPLKVDTDGDGLNDGDEVTKYKTDPLKVDTDSGTIFDGVEVKRGTNPLDPSDDIPDSTFTKKFSNILFLFNDSNVTNVKGYKSKDNIDKICDTLTTLSKLEKMVLSGHTDSIGPKKYNMKLSVKRANAVKKYLISKGVNESVITTEGFGKEKPVAPNKKRTDRKKNRRVEIEVQYKAKK